MNTNWGIRKVGLEINQGIEKITEHTSTLKTGMTQMHTALGVSSLATERWASEFDARLQALQQEVLRSLRTKKTIDMKATPGKYSRRISHRATRMEIVHRGCKKAATCPEEQFLRVVTPAILYYVSRGVPCRKLVGHEEDNLACLNLVDRKALLRQLLQLRFLLWLFTNKYSVFEHTTIRHPSQFRSRLLIEGGLSSSWVNPRLLENISLQQVQFWRGCLTLYPGEGAHVVLHSHLAHARFMKLLETEYGAHQDVLEYLLRVLRLYSDRAYLIAHFTEAGIQSPFLTPPSYWVFSILHQIFMLLHVWLEEIERDFLCSERKIYLETLQRKMFNAAKRLDEQEHCT